MTIRAAVSELGALCGPYTPELLARSPAPIRLNGLLRVIQKLIGKIEV